MDVHDEVFDDENVNDDLHSSLISLRSQQGYDDTDNNKGWMHIGYVK